MIHEYETKVYHFDTDCGGVVYHGKYLDMLLRARDQWLLDESIDLYQYQHLSPVIRKIEIEYHKPARLNDTLKIETKVEMKRAIMNFEQKILNAVNHELVCTALVKVGCINLNTGKLVAISELKD